MEVNDSDFIFYGQTDDWRGMDAAELAEIMGEDFDEPPLPIPFETASF